jgi:parallel beta-helix repeat protein
VTIKSNIKLSRTVVIKCKHRRLQIEGECQNSLLEIKGSGHCLFQITGKGSCITLKNLKLDHFAFEQDKRNIGAAVFVLGTSQAILENCQVVSSHGFGIWGVQNAKCTLLNCQISSLERSGCVFFGKSSLNITSSQISLCGQHGICVRGSVRLSVSKCLITSCRIRGIYGYDKSQITIQDTTISFTQSTEHSAVDFWGGISPPSDSSKHHAPHYSEKCPSEKRFRRSSSPSRDLLVTLDRVIFLHNNCASIRCRDNVRAEILDCFYYSPHFDLCVPLSMPADQLIPLPSFHHHDRGRGTVVWSDEKENESSVEPQNSSQLFLELFRTLVSGIADPQDASLGISPG